MHSLIIFASGKGSNAAAIIDYFRDNGKVRVALIVTNRADAGVVALAEQEHIPFLIVSKARLAERLFIEQLLAYRPSLLVLAGFLLQVPDAVIEAFRHRIINIHPALLPAYGGKGMYGRHVHGAVLTAGEAASGITIHRVDEVYDNGEILLQARCPVMTGDTAETLAARIHRLEHFYYPRAIGYLLGEADAASSAAG